MWLLVVLCFSAISHFILKQRKPKEATLKENQGKEKVFIPMKAVVSLRNLDLSCAILLSRPSRLALWVSSGRSNWPVKRGQRETRQLVNWVLFFTRAFDLSYLRCTLISSQISTICVIAYWKTGGERKNKSKKMSCPSSYREIVSLKMTFRHFWNYFKWSKLLRNRRSRT